MKKKFKKIFCYPDNSISLRCVILSLSRREYLPSAHSVLGNRFEIFHITNRDFL